MLIRRWRASLNKMSSDLCSAHGLVSPVSSDRCRRSSRWQAMTREAVVSQAAQLLPVVLVQAKYIFA